MCVCVRVRVCVRVCMRVCVRVCPPPGLLITSGDVDPLRLVKQVLQLLYGNYSHYR